MGREMEVFKEKKLNEITIGETVEIPGLTDASPPIVFARVFGFHGYPSKFTEFLSTNRHGGGLFWR
jgi:hypothetical protein